MRRWPRRSRGSTPRSEPADPRDEERYALCAIGDACAADQLSTELRPSLTRVLNDPDASVVFNEIRAVGDDWIEFKNVGTAPVDLGGLVLADTDTTVGGAPRPSDGVRFPASTSLAPGQ